MEISIGRKGNENQSTFDKNSSTLSLAATLQGRMWVPSSFQERAIKAEILILMHAIKCNYPFSKLGELVEICTEGFEDSTIAKNVYLSETKARYVTKFGLAPYFRKKVFQDIEDDAETGRPEGRRLLPLVTVADLLAMEVGFIVAPAFLRRGTLLPIVCSIVSHCPSVFIHVRRDNPFSKAIKWKLN
ncbi:hypothetical protein JTE90_004172 [Oedothorax gibbosus]|uniref:Uncharacterized protein n=1 Tax=Oedothorax gibbosus TaxID=931172 RepID=A0AAV6TU97_9ARAC|nr:hypothetical protein JTE90_004172 [Oedothorax gibbosus]